MKRQMQQLRRFFTRTKKYNTTATRAASPATYEDDEDGGNRLSTAFVIVLFLHIIAVVGVFAFARIKENRNSLAPAEPSAQTTAAKISPPKPAPPKPAAIAAIATPARTPKAPAPNDTLRTPPADGRLTHIVKEKETLTKIAFAYSSNIDDIVAANRLKDKDDIHAGQSLLIPLSKPAPKLSTGGETRPAPSNPAQKAANTPPAADRKNAKSYIVRKGDSAVKIAREHGCTYEELVKLNNIKDPKKIQPGQVLKLPVKNG